MERDPSEVTWVRDMNGSRLGLQPVRTADGSFVRLIVPDHGIDKLLGAQEAARLAKMLQDGIAFAEITGAESFRVGPEEL